ncbi:hypothetical protein HY732_01065 [Candidatus Uhrbacteria bacterium]|nr:hypothetical protein [Candidatus Uhrbacteria bacterium]
MDISRLYLVAHRRYTDPHICGQLQAAVNEAIVDGTFLSFEQHSEQECCELELADTFDLNKKFISRSIVFSTILSVFTLPFLISTL